MLMLQGYMIYWEKNINKEAKRLMPTEIFWLRTGLFFVIRSLKLNVAKYTYYWDYTKSMEKGSCRSSSHATKWKIGHTEG